MASLLQLKGRIKAAQNVSKTTKAFQMISASKMKRAQDAALAGRPYVEKLGQLTRSVVGEIDPEKAHPYMRADISPESKTLLIVLSPDKGLCGGLITNLLREFMKYKDQEEGPYILIGKKAEGTVTRFSKEIIASFPFGTTLPGFDAVFPIMKLIDDLFLQKKVDRVKILSTHFTNVFTQTPKITDLLPITEFSNVTNPEEETKKQESFYIFEPSVEELLPGLLKHYVEMTLYQAMLENFVSEQGARMIAMQNATDNANDIIEDLKLEYNKTRQTKITSELLDIVGTKRQQQ